MSEWRKVNGAVVVWRRYLPDGGVLEVGLRSTHPASRWVWQHWSPVPRLRVAKSGPRDSWAYASGARNAADRYWARRVAPPTIPALRRTAERPRGRTSSE